MVVSYCADAGRPVYPPYCGCKDSKLAHFQRRGTYLRRVAEVLVHFFRCTRCMTHITMVPNTCVPYKHYPVREIEPCLDAVVRGRSAYAVDKHDSPGIHQSTIRRWLNQWITNSALLASVAVEKFSRLISGDFRGVYQDLSDHYQSDQFLGDVQVDLCEWYPPVGIFRPLIVPS